MRRIEIVFHLTPWDLYGGAIGLGLILAICLYVVIG